ncbi:protein translocase SEC61 complex subunit gamma [archaeon]|nr:protein translocase SEC61 complex subunit gamma [archaeon]
MEEFNQFNQYNLTLIQRLKQQWIECKRVLKSTRKPTMEEFKTIVKISGLGLIGIGSIGFLIHLVKEIVKRGGSL